MPIEQARKFPPFGVLLLLMLAGAVYVGMLSTISFSVGGGDAAFGQAIASLVLTLGLWIALAILLAVCGAMGEMPKRAGIVAVPLLLLSGVATFVAIDMCSRHIKWAVIFPLVLPLLVALYAVWASMPRLHAALPAKQTSILAWGLISVLSIAALLSAM